MKTLRRQEITTAVAANAFLEATYLPERNASNFSPIRRAHLGLFVDRQIVDGKTIDIILRWHDLRHEYAPRLVEKSVPLAQVLDLLGHASTTTTERYDNQKLENLQLAAAKLESGKTFEAPPRANVSPTNCQVFQEFG